MEEPKCLRCAEPMEPGKAVTLFGLRWVSKATQRLVMNRWFTPTYSLSAYRCPKCGMLEWKAIEDGK